MRNFSAEIHEHINDYVYRLVDPRTGNTFYVGKGRGDRVFQHVQGVMENGDWKSEKMDHIRDIQKAGLEPIAIIHRHGLSEEEAFHVEAALIDAYPGLTNIQSGHGDNGIRNVEEIERLYKAEIADLNPDTYKVVLININQSSVERKSTYKAVHYAWKADPARANQADYVLAVNRGIIEGVYQVEGSWIPATEENFPDAEDHVEGRYGFHGHEALPEVWKDMVGKRVPDNLRHVQNPVRYNFPRNADTPNNDSGKYVEFDLYTYNGFSKVIGKYEIVRISPMSKTIEAGGVNQEGIMKPSLEEKHAALQPMATSDSTRQSIIRLAKQIIGKGAELKKELQRESDEEGNAVHPLFLTVRIMDGEDTILGWEGPIGISPSEGLLGEIYTVIKDLL